MQTPLSKRTLGWALVFGAAGVALCFVPLFDLVGYELAFAVGILSALSGAHLGAQVTFEARRDMPRSQAAAAEGQPLRTVVGLWAQAATRVWLLGLLPLGLVTLNALRVRNCDYPGGLVWHLVLPVTTGAVSAAAGVVAGLVRPFRRRIAPTLLALGVVLASLVWSGYRFYAAPAIFAYDPFGGYFPGTLYDEAVAIGAPLLWARLYHLAAALAALALSALFLDGRLALSLGAARRRTGEAALAAATLAVALGLWSLGPRAGFRLDAADVAARLGAVHETEHFVLHYSADGPWAKDLALHALDFEYQHARLAALLGVEPDGKVHAFLFDSAQQKASLMGAANTFIAKPWRREIYLQAEGWPHPVMDHELAHVFAGRLGDPIFGVARSGARVNVGLIEGIAVAAAWHGAPMTPHQLVKAMREGQIEPPLERVLGLSFLGLNAGQAYNVAGSFCRFLLDKHGPKPLGEVFRRAGVAAAWRDAYGVPFETLRAEWSQMIDAVEVPAREAAVMRERLARPSVFHKVCAHELALRREAARKALAAGDRARALRALEAVCEGDPDDPAHVAEVMEAAWAAERQAQAAQAAERLLAHPKRTAALEARAHALLGDLALARGAVEEAARRYALAEALPLDEGTARLIAVKRLATAEPPGPIADGLRRFLAAPRAARDAALDLLGVAELVRLEPRPLFHYLYARQLEPRGRFAEAAQALARALEAPDGLPDARFRREALRLRGKALFRAGRYADAQAAFEALAREAQGAEGAAAQVEAATWIGRAAFALSHRPGAGYPAASR